jgi:hypothetical protein
MGWTPIKNQTVKLDECPFCHGGETKFLGNPASPHLLMIVHYPDKGVICPARYEQVCDSQEQGAAWWNDRTPKTEVK